MINALFLVGGFVVLVLGAEALVRGASRLAAAAGIPALIIGLTVVAFGTSAPELAVSIGSLLHDAPDIAIGNIVGSNIFNVLFILGLSALAAPLAVSAQLVRFDVPIMIAGSILVWVLALDYQISRSEGLLLAAILVVYIGLQIHKGREASAASTGGLPATRSAAAIARDVLLIVAGLLLLVAGSKALVAGATGIARAMGVSELIIGLTIIAVGTSLPELATSVLASIRGEREIAIGNVVGSNIFNLFSVLGFTALVSPNGVAVAQGALKFDIPVMTAVAIACLPVFFHRHRLGRREGAVLFGYYIAYVVYLFLAATTHHALDEYRAAMIGFVLPLTVLTLALIIWRSVGGPTRNAE